MKGTITCVLCNFQTKSKRLFSYHIKKHHLKIKEYYDRFLKKKDDDICKRCGKQTKWNIGESRYGIYCGKSCMVLDTIIKRKQTWLLRNGVDNPSKAKKIKRKKECTTFQHYGVQNPLSSLVIQKQIQQKCLKKYGVKHFVMSIEKFKRTNKPYILPTGETIFKQGYEVNFLDYVFNNHFLNAKDIVFHPSPIEYNTEQTTHHYYPDFYIPRFNLIVEIKSTFTKAADKQFTLKKEATLKRGYDYICIIDNNFQEFFDKYLKDNKEK